MKCLTSIFFLMLANWYSVSAEFKIINGTQAIMHEYPQLVSLRVNNEHICGGSLLNGNTVLTAAHCVWEFRQWPLSYLKYYGVQVVLGEYDLHRVYGVEKYFQVTKIILHNSYQSESAYVYGNDVALLKFDGFVSNTQYDYINHTLLDTTSFTRPGSRCDVVGWGSIQPSGVGAARFLQKATINVIWLNDDHKILKCNLDFIEWRVFESIL